MIDQKINTPLGELRMCRYRTRGTDQYRINGKGLREKRLFCDNCGTKEATDWHVFFFRHYTGVRECRSIRHFVYCKKCAMEQVSDSKESHLYVSYNDLISTGFDEVVFFEGEEPL